MPVADGRSLERLHTRLLSLMAFPMWSLRSRKEDKYAASPFKPQTLSCDTSSWAKAVEKDSISWCVEEQDHTRRTGVVRVVIRKIDLRAAFFSSLYIQFFLIILENCEPSLPSPFGSCSMNVTKVI